MTEDKFKAVDNVVTSVQINNVSIKTADGEFQARKANGDMNNYYIASAEITTKAGETHSYIMTYQIEWNEEEKKYIMYEPNWNIWSYDLVELFMQCYSWNVSYINSSKG